jgi:hypothetical protein
METHLPSSCPETGQVYPPILLSLHINDFRRYSVILWPRCSGWSLSLRFLYWNVKCSYLTDLLHALPIALILTFSSGKSDVAECEKADDCSAHAYLGMHCFSWISSQPMPLSLSLSLKRSALQHLSRFRCSLTFIPIEIPHRVPQFLQLSRVWVTIDVVWIGNWIYWPLTGHNCK